VWIQELASRFEVRGFRKRLPSLRVRCRFCLPATPLKRCFVVAGGLPLWWALTLPVQRSALIGDVARQLSSEDLAQIHDVVAGERGRPWLLAGSRGMVPDVRSIEAYLTPTRIASDLRRGAVVSVVHATPAARRYIQLPESTGSSRWVVPSSGSYAQVAVAGRPFDRITGVEDVNRPFQVTGSFDDADLVGMIRFVRSSPSGPPATDRRQVAVRGDLPVLRVDRQDDLVEVRVRITDAEWQRVRLRKLSSGWEVVSIDTVFR
jgi:hypothetical protein